MQTSGHVSALKMPLHHSCPDLMHLHLIPHSPLRIHMLDTAMLVTDVLFADLRCRRAADQYDVICPIDRGL